MNNSIKPIKINPRDHNNFQKFLNNYIQTTAALGNKKKKKIQLHTMNTTYHDKPGLGERSYFKFIFW